MWPGRLLSGRKRWRAGTVRLVGTDAEGIIAETARLVDGEDACAAKPFGDEHASERILAELTGG